MPRSGGHLLLDIEDIFELQVVFVGPQLLSIRCPDEFRRDPHRIAALANAADHHVPHAELFADFAGIHHSSLKRDGRVSRDDREPPVTGEETNDVFRQAIAEIVVLRIVRHVPERQHGDRQSRDGLGLHEFRDDIVKAGHFESNRAAGRNVARRNTVVRNKPSRLRIRFRRADCLNIADEPEAALVQRPNKSLVGSVVSKRTPGAIDAAGERGLGDDPAIPDRLDQFILADNPITVAHQVNDEIEDLRLDVNGQAKPAQLLLAEVDLELGKPVLHFHLC